MDSLFVGSRLVLDIGQAGIEQVDSWMVVVGLLAAW
jgi:hypothetical protein